MSCGIFALAPVALSANDGGTGRISLFDLVSQGGWAMWPLGILMVATFYLSFYCWRQTARKRFFITENDAGVQRALQGRNRQALASIAASSDTVMARLLARLMDAIRNRGGAVQREDLETVFMEEAEGEESLATQSIQYLNVVATVAPMVGLLGTVSGMIGAFQKIGEGGMGKPEELAGNIGEALITTATGLVIGIPAMVLYFYFRNRLTQRMLEVAREGGRFIDALEGEGG